MAPKRAAAAAASGSASDASDAEAGAGRHRRRRHSASPARSRSRSKTPPPDLRPNAAATLSSIPTSAGADYVAASDSDAAGRVQSPRRRRERSPTPRSDSDADAARRVASPRRRRERSPTPRSDSDADAAARRVASPRRRRERSPTPRSDSDAAAAGRVPSPRRNRERSRRLYSDSDSDADAAAAGRDAYPRRNRERSPALHSDSDNSGASEDGGEGNISPPRARRSTRIETSNIKPVSTRLIQESRRPAGAASSQGRPKRRRRSPALPSVEYHKRPPRVWSPEDEVTILRALLAFRGKKGRLPASLQDTTKLEGQIRGKLTANASTTQLSDKIRRLKHKYKLLAIRAKKGREPDLPTDREREVYELCKKVWGSISLDGFSEVGGSHTYENAGDEESNEEQEIEESDDGMDSGWDVREPCSNKKLKASRFENGKRNTIAGNGNAFATGGKTRTSQGGGGVKDDSNKGKQMYPYLWEAVEELSKDHPSGQIFRKAFAVLEKSKARAIEEKLRKFRTSEIRQQLRRMDLMKETVSMVLDALEGTG